MAFIVDLFGSWTGLINNAIHNAGINPKYDFYLERDNFPYNNIEGDINVTLYSRDYSGHTFNKEIATTLRALQSSTAQDVTTEMKASAKIDGIILTEDPKSAFAYCYHKNKRNANGEVVEQKWFLPAIDEIEDIALGAYDEFDRVFQKQEYWSCQPAYDNNTITVSYLYSSANGIYKSDDLDRARATSVETSDGINYTPYPSGATGDAYNLNIYRENISTGWKPNYVWRYDVNPLNKVVTYDIGNKARTANCRIRAVYRSGTGTKPAN